MIITSSQRLLSAGEAKFKTRKLEEGSFSSLGGEESWQSNLNISGKVLGGVRI